MKTRNATFRGFTMIELLLALVLTTLLTMALSSMIGHAARERETMRQVNQQPRWVDQALTQIERDLTQAKFWAGAKDRLVIIGLDDEGRPARIEYRWLTGSAPPLLVREALPLTAEGSTTVLPSLLAAGLVGLRVGPYEFGEVKEVDSGTATSVGRSSPIPEGVASGGGGVSVMVDGVAVPLRGVGDQAVLALTVAGDSPTTYRRKAVLR